MQIHTRESKNVQKTWTNEKNLSQNKNPKWCKNPWILESKFNRTFDGSNLKCPKLKEGIIKIKVWETSNLKYSKEFKKKSEKLFSVKVS